MNLQKNKFRLEYFSGFEAQKEEVVDEISVDAIRSLMQSFDWKEFHMITLSKSDENWLSVGGNLGEDGLTCVYSEEGEIFVIADAPTSINQITRFLIDYFNGDEKFKIENSYNGEAEAKKEERSRKEWSEEFLRRQEEEKRSIIRRSLLMLIFITVIASIAYYWHIDELQFWGQRTEFAKAKVIKTKMHHIGRGYYMQTVTYQFQYKKELYTSTFEAGKAIGRRQKGDILKIKFSVVNPKRSKMIGVYKFLKKNKNSRNIKLKGSGSSKEK